MFDDITLKNMLAISNPRMWFFCFGTYLLGVGMGGYLFKEALLTVSVWQFIVFTIWSISVGMYIGLWHSGKRDLFLSKVIHTMYLIVSFFSGLFFLNSEIILLSIFLYGMDFAYHTPLIIGLYKKVVYLLYGVVILVPFVIGYVSITKMLPSTDCLLALILYGVAMGIYANAVEGEYTLFSKNTALMMSGILSIVCGSILARYGAIYALTVSSFLVVVGMSFFAKNSNEMHAIHTKAFYMHFIVGLVVGTYFFI